MFTWPTEQIQKIQKQIRMIRKSLKNTRNASTSICNFCHHCNLPCSFSSFRFAFCVASLRLYKSLGCGLQPCMSIALLFGAWKYTIRNNINTQILIALRFSLIKHGNALACEYRSLGQNRRTLAVGKSLATNYVPLLLLFQVLQITKNFVAQPGLLGASRFRFAKKIKYGNR